ncbi:hypothetical protein BH09VER1_BH09VER1_45520 [soil metagenome]
MSRYSSCYQLHVQAKRALLIFLLISVVAIFAARACWNRSQRAYLQSLIWGSCAYSWNPKAMEDHRKKYAPVVSQYLLESNLWSGAGWSLIAAEGVALILLVFPRRNQPV